jgi:D-galactarolactone cycloisomerase
MIIRQIDTFPLYYPLPRPYGDANGYKTYRSCYLFRIRTQSGLVGWGECTGWLPGLEREFRDRVIPFLLGKKANEHLKMTARIQTWNRRIAAGVSMALTEIFAHKAGVSVCDLWGGKQHTSIPVYASFQSYREQPDWKKASLKDIEQAVSRGFSQIKVKIGGRPLAEDQEHIQSLMEMVDGSVQVAVDANQSYDAATAIQWNPVFDRWGNWLWLEEPMPLAQVKAYEKVSARCSIPLAGGENLAKPEDFLPFLRKKGLDLIQPDPVHMGGMDEYRNTLQMGRCFGIRVSPHTFDGFLSGWYAILAQSCLGSWSKMKGETVEPVEWDVMECPWNQGWPIQPKNGVIPIPEGVGVGVDWDIREWERWKWNGMSFS